MIHDLRQDGYDVIILDLWDGADYMQRNAFLLVKLLELVDSTKVGDHPTVVAGTSMGGQITRYALAWMEQQGMEHCSNIWVSMDSPHKGANVAPGLQHMFKFLADRSMDKISDFAAKKFDHTLARPAARQMLNYQVGSSAQNLRNAWYTELNALGYPEKTWRTGISNGTRDSVGLEFDDRDSLFHFDWSPTICLGAEFIRLDVWATPGKNMTIFNNVIFDGKAPSSLGLAIICLALRDLPCWICANSQLGFATQKTVVDPAIGSVDRAPGGFRTTFKQVEHEFNNIKEFDNFVMNPTIEAHYDKHSFIPTISGLDINTNDLFFNLEANIPDFENPDPSLTSFNAIYAPRNLNEQHSEVTNENLDFVMDQLRHAQYHLPATLTGTSPNNGVYNVAHPSQRYISSVYIANGGRLHINGFLEEKFGPGWRSWATYFPEIGSTLEVEAGNPCTGPVLIEVDDGGELVLGAHKPNNKAKLYVSNEVEIDDGGVVTVHRNSDIIVTGKKKVHAGGLLDASAGAGGTILIKPTGELNISGEAIIGFDVTLKVEGRGRLHIEDGGTLRVQSWGNLLVDGTITLGANSSLIIEDNALFEVMQNGRFFYSPNADLQLRGSNAVLEVAGELFIQDSADFTFTYPNANSGFMRIMPNGEILGLGQTTPSTNVSVTLTGQGQQDKILEVDNNVLSIPESFDQVTVQDGKVQFIGAAKLSVATPLTLNNVLTHKTNVSASQQAGFTEGWHLFGQDSLTITDCVFDRAGIRADLFVAGNPLFIDNSVFKNCPDYGLSTQGRGAMLEQVEFLDNSLYGWVAIGTDFLSVIDGAIFENNRTAIYYESSDGAVLDVIRASINNNSMKGIRVGGSAVLNVKCTNITENQSGIYASHNPTINLSTLLNSGNNFITDNFLNFELYHAKTIRLNVGYNTLYTDNWLALGSYCKPRGMCIIHNTLGSTTTATCLQKTTLEANRNKWVNSSQSAPPVNMLNNPFGNVKYSLQTCPSYLNGGQPIQIKDDNPMDSILPCYLEVVAFDPCSGSETACLNDPYIQCPACTNITTADFNDVKLNEAVKTAVANMESGMPDSIRTSIDQFRQILTYPIPEPNGDEDYVLDIAYDKSLEALGRLFLEGEVTRADNEEETDTSVLDVLIIQDTLIRSAQRMENYQGELDFSIHKAKTLRMADRRTEAVSVFDDILTWAASDDQTRVERLRCLTHTEQLVLDSVVAKEDYDSLLTAICPPSPNSISAKHSGFVPEEPELESEVQDKTNQMEVYPNPAAANLHIITPVDNGVLKVYNMEGKITYREDITQPKVDIDIGHWTSGMYMVVFQPEAASGHHTEKVMVR